MIASIKLLKDYHGLMGYVCTNENCKQLKEKLIEGLQFSNGINILVGKNGCGKSTLMNIIRYLTFCNKYFVSTLNAKDLSTRFDLEKNIDLYKSYSMSANYNLPFYNLYSMQHDITRHDSVIVQSFKKAAQYMDSTEHSSGQNQLLDISRLWQTMFEEEHYSVNSLIKKYENEDNGAYAEETKIAKEFYKINGYNFDRRTVLMDEPDQGLDVDNLRSIYDVLIANRSDVQLIVSLHNVALIQKLCKHPEINWIEISEGYLDKITNFINE